MNSSSHPDHSGGLHLPQAVWMALVFLLLGVVVTLWVTRPKQMLPTSGFGKILHVYSFKPEVNATAYESKSGNATVIWLSGIDETPTIGPIWQVYSYSPDVNATAYESKSGNATVIWLSGMDDWPTNKSGVKQPQNRPIKRDPPH